MPPKIAGINGKIGGAPFDPSRNPRFSDRYSAKSQIPRSQMPPKFAGNQRKRSVAGRKMKQVWRRKEKPSPPPPWIELPRDITANILYRLGAVEILGTAEKVCSTWRSVCKDPAMWRVVDMGNPGDPTDMPYDLDKMCRHALDRSQCHLVDINLEHFASDELLDYISERSGNLRRLRLKSCYYLSDEGLLEAIKRLPKLEELHIIITPISNKGIETICRSCPLLKSFTFHRKTFRYHNTTPSTFYDDIGMGDDMGDMHAFAIASSMPELRHLGLLGNGLTNKGLEAILDGCPLLESLDLRRCYDVKLIGDLGKRLSAQIKRMRYPDESTSYYEFSVDELDPDFCDPRIFDFDDSDGGYDYDFDEINIDNYHLYIDDYTRPDHEDYRNDDDDIDFFGFFPF